MFYFENNIKLNEKKNKQTICWDTFQLTDFVGDRLFHLLMEQVSLFQNENLCIGGALCNFVGEEITGLGLSGRDTYFWTSTHKCMYTVNSI